MKALIAFIRYFEEPQSVTVKIQANYHFSKNFWNLKPRSQPTRDSSYNWTPLQNFLTNICINIDVKIGTFGFLSRLVI